jgi:hypothetical protein
MKECDKEDLLAILRAMLRGVETGDTLEGSVSFQLVPFADSDTWEVQATYRTGYLEGPGRIVII